MVYFKIFFPTLIILALAIFLYMKTRKEKEPMYEGMLSIKGWVGLIIIVVGIIMYILQKIGVV